MFENKVVENTGIPYSRYIASWRKLELQESAKHFMRAHGYVNI